MVAREDRPEGVQTPLSGGAKFRGVHAAASPAPEPDVLVLNWDLRHPLFLPSPQDTVNNPTLAYSSSLQDLADSLAPRTSYLAIHWRMETVPPGKTFPLLVS